MTDPNLAIAEQLGFLIGPALICPPALQAALLRSAAGALEGRAEALDGGQLAPQLRFALPAVDNIAGADRLLAALWVLRLEREAVRQGKPDELRTFWRTLRERLVDGLNLQRASSRDPGVTRKLTRMLRHRGWNPHEVEKKLGGIPLATLAPVLAAAPEVLQ